MSKQAELLKQLAEIELSCENCGVALDQFSAILMTKTVSEPKVGCVECVEAWQAALDQADSVQSFAEKHLDNALTIC